MKNFPLYKQYDAMDCGPACLRMIAKYYGEDVSIEYLRNKSQFVKDGVSMLGLSDAAESIGMRCAGARLSFDELLNAPLPAILHWNQYHFVVLTPSSSKNKLVIADPAKGMIKLPRKEFLRSWLSLTEAGIQKGMALFLELTPDFKSLNAENYKIAESEKNIGWRTVAGVFKKNKIRVLITMLCLLMASAILLAFPYLTQNIVDKGINSKNLGYIELILAGQLMLLISETAIDFLRSRMLLKLSMSLNLELLSSFWAKLLRLPLEFFESRHAGDIIQRIVDYRRIENFLTGSALSTIFSFLSVLIFSVVLFNYSPLLFSIFFITTFFYLLWIRLFLRMRSKLDTERFYINSQSNNATMQLIHGIHEIKLNNAEQSYRNSWERLQAILFKLNFKNLGMNQLQQIGILFINQGKNILITFIAAKLVIDHHMTLGMMLATQYIVGQLNGPIEQLNSFTQQAQDAKMSMERMDDIYKLPDEESSTREYANRLQDEKNILIKDLSFAYPGAGNEPALKNINLKIPEGKLTAIVGTSGSGKTTLIKLLLRFYEGYEGCISIGASDFRSISPKFWRSITGAVMQDSFIFNDTIRKNIIVNEESSDEEKLSRTCRMACIDSFIETLPLGIDTKLGHDGNGLSGGQKQRLTIARAVYKNPQFIFLDEPTNALDASHEKVILQNLNEFFEDKTVIIVAHRLSTVKHADNIVVLDKGRIVEQGNHSELISKKGKYFELIRDQLELGN